MEDRVVPATIIGTVFQDFNANGAFDNGTTSQTPNAGGTGNVRGSIDSIPLAGITVRAYNSAGTLVGTVGTSAANGTYTMTVPDSTPVRVQFTIPGSLTSQGYTVSPHGTNNGSTVQFLNGFTGTQTVDMTLVRNNEFSVNNPTLVTAQYVFGDQVNGPNRNGTAIKGSLYNAGNQDPGTNTANSTAATVTFTTPARQVGTVFGLTYNQSSNVVYASAFTKLHTGYGPNVSGFSGNGTIYSINPATGAATPFVNLNQLFGATTAGVDFRAGYTAETTSTTFTASQYFNDSLSADSWDTVGKTSLGGIAYDPINQKLFVMNLADRMLYVIPTNVTPTAANIQRVSIPGVATVDHATGTGPLGDLRPFAVTYYKGLIYVGIVNSAESTIGTPGFPNGNRAMLRAYVYTVDPSATTPAFSADHVFMTGTAANGGLDYPRELAARYNGNGPSDWMPWTPTFRNNSNSGLVYAQPMLSGISFDAQGNMTLGFRDRAGDQGGNFTPANKNNLGENFETYPSGEILRAAGNPTLGWTLESGGRSGGLGNGPTNTNFGLGTGSGARGYFYYQQDYSPTGGHGYVTSGSVTQVPGFPDVVVTSFDPAYTGDFQTGGLRWMDEANTGALRKSYTLYVQDLSHTSNFGKASGIGGVTYVTPAAPVEIGNRVWDDVNANGIQDAGEAGIGGATVRLYAPGAGPETATPNLLATATTASDGTYYFSSDPNRTSTASKRFNIAGLLPNTTGYVVEFLTPTGKVLTFPIVGADREIDSNAEYVTGVGGATFVLAKVDTGAPGKADHTIDAGFFAGVTIGNFVWDDKNANGKQDAGEPGIPGVTLTLTDLNGGTPIQTKATTDANGKYLFTELPGKYSVAIDAANFGTGKALDGFTASASAVTGTGYTTANDSNGSPSGTSPATLAAGASDPDVDFGFYKRVTIGNFVFEDVNANGIQDVGTDKGIADVELTLNGTNGLGKSVTVTTKTDANGAYSFSADPGTYTVSITSPTGYTPTLTGKGDKTTDSNNTTVANAADAATKVSGGEDLTIDFGYVKNVTIGNFVFEDINADGIQDGGDKGIANVELTLNGKDIFGTTVSTTTKTDANGAYSFTAAPGEYTVTITSPTGYIPTVLGKGDADTDSNNTTVANATTPATLGSGGKDLSIDFGYVKNVTIGNYVFEDINSNGIQDVGIDKGILGVELTLNGKDLYGNTISTKTTTDANGAYTFTAAPGTYTVTVTSPTGYVPTILGQGTTKSDSNDTTVANAADAATKLSGGEDLTIDFGYVKNVTIGNFVFEDVNADGIQDGGDKGIADVELTLNGKDIFGTTVSTKTKTDANGEYLFTAAPGEYTVTITSPAGYVPTILGQGNAGTDSNDTTIANPTTPTTLSSGGSDLTIDFGYVKGVTIGNYVFEDIDADGIQDVGTDKGIADVELTLNGKDIYGKSVTATTKTDADGMYLFTAAPGEYTVTITSPTGYIPTVLGKGDKTTDSNDTTVANAADAATKVSGGEDLTIDFGYVKNVTIGNYVFEDINADGIQDGGDKGIANVELTLNGTDLYGKSVTATTKTDANGAYSFTAAPGEYTVTITSPTGYIPTVLGKGDADTDSNNTTVANATTPATLGSGGKDLSIDFGYVQNVTIGNYVFEDINADGIQDGGDKGIADVELALNGTDLYGKPVTATTKTDANGAYSFTAAPGEYTVTITSPTGYIPTVLGKGDADTDSNDTTIANATSPAALGSGGKDLSIDFGYVQNVTIGNYVFEDINADGIQDGGDKGIANVELALNGTDLYGKSVTATTKTDANGEYSFTAAPGTYTVTITSPTGYSLTALGKGNADTDSNDTTVANATSPAALGSGGKDFSIDFGYVKNVTIGNFVFEDVNADGIQDNKDLPIANVELTLNGKDVFGNTVSTTTKTDANGEYLFTAAPGTYTVTVTSPTGYIPTLTGQGDATTDSNDTKAPSPTTPATLASGGSDLTIDYGFVKGVTIGNYVFEDIDADGIQDVGTDKGIADVELTLNGKDVFGTTVTATTKTDADGKYLFTAAPGEYTVTITSPTGYTPTLTGKGDKATDSNDTTIANAADAATKVSGGEDLTIDFGYVKNVTIGNYVFEDINADGIQDGGDKGIANVELTLSGTDYKGNAVSRKTTTDANGAYSFSELPGEYTVTITSPTGYIPTVLGNGNAKTDSNDTTVANTADAATKLSGGEDLTIDFGYVKNVTIGNYVFEDVNANGKQDVGIDKGILGVELTLSGTDLYGKQITAKTTTDADGKYLFTAAPGTYTVTVTSPTGYIPTATGQGTSLTDSNNSKVANATTPATLGSGGEDLSIDFGYYKNVTIGDFVWNDLNANGVQDMGEPGIEGVVITLSGADGVGGAPLQTTATTDANGKYQFTEAPGTYTVSIDKSNFAVGGKLVDFFASPTGKGDAKTDSNGDPSATLPPDLPSGADDPTIDFGFYQKVTIGDFVWFDKNTDGIQDGGEPGIANVTITLTGTNGAGIGVTKTATTDANGNYQFTVDPGKYTVTVDGANFGAGKPLNGLVGTTTKNGTASTDNNGSPSGTSPATLPGGSDDPNVDFGFRTPPPASPPAPPPTVSSIAGTVYQDLNNDGIKQASEPGIGGVTVTLINPGTGATTTTVTAADGTYKFSNLTAGTYRVVETQPTAFGDGKDKVGTSGGTLIAPDTINAINLPANTDATGYDFGELISSIAGLVYHDQNNDGTRQGTEPAIGGVTVTLFNATTGTQVATTKTAADGTYLFDGLPAGKYRVVETQPAAFADGKDSVGSVGGTLVATDTIDAIDLPAGVAAVNYNFGEVLVTGVSGTVFLDKDKDGNLDTGEPPIPGVTITLRDSKGTIVSTTVTDKNGFYEFPNLPAGKYTITETQPTGYGDSPTGPFAPNTRTVTLLDGVPQTNQNFGDTLSGLSGLVYVDTNNDGVRQTTEAPIAGVTVTLFDSAGKQVATTKTGVDGTYQFTDLLAGKYKVVETQPTAYGDGKDSVGSVGGTLVPTDTIDSINLPVGTLGTNYNFGEILTGVSGTVFLDRDRDGNLDTGEPGIPGVTVTLRDSKGAVVGTVITDANGFYNFPGLVPGTYTITETQPTGYGNSPAGPFAPNTRTVTLVGGTGQTNQNFGDTLSSLAGLVYVDSNNDGIRQATEAPIGGVTVQLFDAVTGVVVATTKTAADGTYKFNDLFAGKYKVVETQPTAYADGKDSVGSVGGTLVPTDTIDAITLPVNTDAVNYNFGELIAGLSGKVFLDVNKDGQFDPGEGPIPGVIITLRDGNGNVVGTTKTDANGDYNFPNLLPGKYTVTETQPTQYGDPVSGPFAPNTRTVTMGTTPITNQNFGDTPAGLSGLVYHDVNNDGKRQMSEPAIPGATVQLFDATGTLIRTTTTGADGYYNFNMLTAGTYRVVETQPVAFNDGKDKVGTVGGALVAPDTIDAIPLPAGVLATGYNFGEILPMSNRLSGTVYYDKNQDKTYQPGSDSPLANITVTLRDSNGNVVATQQTAADGTYSFSNIPAGTYTITETQPTGYGSSETPFNVRTVTMTPTSNITDQNFGDTLGTISGKVYLDYNLSGAFNNAGVNPDTGIPGITVTLRDSTGAIVGQVKTDANGNYRFTDLRPGTYTVRETQPPMPTSLFNGYYDGADNLGTLGGTQPQKNAQRLALGIDQTTQISQNGRSYNFGELPPADPNGFVYIDANKNGIKDPGEKGIAGVAITISGTAFAGTIFARPIVGTDVPGGSLTVFTDANGFYEFNPIPPGVYTIREAQPAGFLDGLEQNGDPTQPAPTVGNDVFSNLQLDPFPVRGPFNFGEILPLPGTPSKRGLLGSML